MAQDLTWGGTGTAMPQPRRPDRHAPLEQRRLDGLDGCPRDDDVPVRSSQAWMPSCASLSRPTLDFISM
jgi:hypothetical protein